MANKNLVQNEVTSQPVIKKIVENTKGELKKVLVSDIIPDPNQPRKTFYKLSMDELVASVKACGAVLQSLLLRKHGDKYMIIFGERRWRAASQNGLKEVPAIIIEATDEQTLSIQLMENLQRENLVPMEQAIAFKQLLEKCQMNIREIALNLGKSEYFVRQQIKLTDLIPQWQKILTKRGISLSIALQIAVLPEKAQKELYENHVNKEDEKAERPVIHIDHYTLQKYKGLLSEACFDITDPELDKKAGACTTCPFNTASNSLFPDEAQNPRCNNILCFRNKSVVHQNREFNKAKDDPATLLVFESYGTPDYVTKLKSEGHEILRLGYTDECREIKEPQQPEWKEFEKWAKRQKKPERVIKADFKKAEETYAFKKQVFDKHLASGKYKKAFVVFNDDKSNQGKYITVEITPQKPKAKDTKTAIANGNATLQDIDNEIERLKDREKRAKELDNEKVHEKIILALTECKAFHELPITNNKTDNVLIRFLLFEQLGYTNRSTILKAIKAPKLFSGDPGQFYKCLESLSNQQIAYLVRHLLLSKYGGNLPINNGGFMIRKMAETLGMVPIADFEKEQNEIAAKRQQRVNERIDQLIENKKKLVKDNKSSKKQVEKKKPIAA